MDCRTCQPTLIDLLHGELATDAAEEAHAHLQHCQSCRGALDKLAQGQRLSQPLPMLEPPQAVTARLLLLAEERARAVVAQRKAQQQQRPSAWQSLLEFLGRFAMARQVGMATIMLLIVAVGLWKLQEPGGSSPRAVGTVVSADPSGEAVPSTGVQPAEPLDLHVDLRSGRIRSKDEQRAANAAPSPSATPPAAPVWAAPAEEPAPAALAERSAAAEREVSGRRSRRPASKPAAVRADQLEVAEKKEASDDLLADKAVASTAAERRAFPASAAVPTAAPEPAPPEARKSKSGPALEDDAIGESLEGAVAKTSSARSSEPMAQSAPGKGASAAPQPARSPSDLYASGVERERQGDASSAQQSYSQAARQSIDPALQRRAQLGAARTTATVRGCSAALPAYQKVVDAAPNSPEAGEALIAMARCRTQRGEHQLARSLLQRAERIPQSRRAAASLLDATAAEAEAQAAPAQAAPAKPAASSAPPP